VLDEQTGTRLCAVLAGCGEDQVAIRSAGVFARRLVRAPRPPARQRWQPRGTVLITGGTGAIGGHVARWLAGRGAPHIALTSRSGPAAPGAAAQAATLAAAGATVRIAACDSARRADLAGLLDRIDADGETLTALFHAAGTAPGGPVHDANEESLDGVLAPKADGAAFLDELTAGRELDAFVMFSSGAAVWGSGGLAGYAAANAYLDALAENRQARGLAGASVAWGLWGGGGMGDGPAGAQLKRLGVRDMDPLLATSALAQALDGGTATLTVADIDWARFAPVFTLRRASPLIAGLPEADAALAATTRSEETGGNAAGETPPALAGQLAGLPRAGQDRLLADLVRAQAAAVLGYQGAEDIEPARAFKDLGFDSVTALEFRNRLGTATGIALPATLVYDHPNPAVLAAYLRSELVPDDGQTGADPILAELGHLESGLRKLDPSCAMRDEITSTLRGMLSNWMQLQHPAEPAADLDGEQIQFQNATPDEVFEFLDKELG
jgi:NADP-dependent 3-hydroxy acid dehydrogenase YdfG/acyl carrier protein